MTATTMTQPQSGPSEAQSLQLLKLMEELILLMEREITVVETRAPESLEEIVARKQRLLVEYQAEFKSVTKNADWLNALLPAQKSLLRKLGEKMREVTERNASVLKAASAATQRLLQGIMQTVREEKCAPVGYQHLLQAAPPSSAPPAIFNTTA
jgi:flagellar biosynthesis/type III secretory pathway chaperone